MVNLEPNIRVCPYCIPRNRVDLAIHGFKTLRAETKMPRKLSGELTVHGTVKRWDERIHLM